MKLAIDIPPTLEPVRDALLETLAEVERVFDEELVSELPPVDEMCRHIERYRGKMLRPSLVILFGLAARANLDAVGSAWNDAASVRTLLHEAHPRAAAVCEMIHMATLVHDDVLDEADTRRRGQTVNRLRGNEFAVMLGDYLIASSYHLCATIRDHDTSLMLSAVSQRLCTGELLQLHHRDDLSLNEATYFELIERKTASLIAESCRLGAHLGGADRAIMHAAYEFGRLMGTAFQIRDDLLDLTGDRVVVGKTLGRDLEKGKLTLPVIIALRSAGADARLSMIESLEAVRGDGPDHRADPERVALIRDQLEASGALAKAERKVSELINGASGHLRSLPASPARDLIQLLAERTIDRAF